MKKALSIFSVIVMIMGIMSFASCKSKEVEQQHTTYIVEEKSTTKEPKQIENLPETDDERVETLNAALEYFDVYCYKYTKSVKCTISDLSIGELSKASNGAAAFRSIFGETDTTRDYEYKASNDVFKKNSIQSGFTVDNIIESDVKTDGDNMILTIKFPEEVSPTDKSGNLHLLHTDYLNREKVSDNLEQFKSSASTISVSASNISITLILNTIDSSLQKLTVDYDESFSLGGVKLVQLEGSTVTAKSHTTIVYSNLK